MIYGLYCIITLNARCKKYEEYLLLFNSESFVFLHAI